MNTLKFCIVLARLFFHEVGLTQTEASCLESESRRQELVSIDEGFITQRRKTSAFMPGI
ncbi:hypothetical protein LC612_36160 [Nostoc sp. CHAB 5834]|nr:hypothetical protein [Nostoc sp. CHAB 5834]